MFSNIINRTCHALSKQLKVLVAHVGIDEKSATDVEDVGRLPLNVAFPPELGDKVRGPDDLGDWYDRRAVLTLRSRPANLI